MKNIQKTNKNYYCLGGISPTEGPEKKKTLVETVLQTIVVGYNVCLSTSPYSDTSSPVCSDTTMARHIV